MDLTAITTPFGLLDAETQEALTAHGGPYQVWGGRSGWTDCERTLKRAPWRHSFVYRVKPAPPKPREYWLRGGNNYISLADAEDSLYGNSFRLPIIHVREVIE